MLSGLDAHNRKHTGAKCRTGQVRRRESLPSTMVVYRSIGNDLVAGSKVNSLRAQTPSVFSFDCVHQKNWVEPNGRWLVSVKQAKFPRGILLPPVLLAFRITFLRFITVRTLSRA